jgi:hypothetical protein
MKVQGNVTHTKFLIPFPIFLVQISSCILVPALNSYVFVFLYSTRVLMFDEKIT